jgi:hypothetical protein
MPQQRTYLKTTRGQRIAQHRGPKMPELKLYEPNNPWAQPKQDRTREKAGTETVNGPRMEKGIVGNKPDGSTISTSAA